MTVYPSNITGYLGTPATGMTPMATAASGGGALGGIGAYAMPVLNLLGGLYAARQQRKQVKEIKKLIKEQNELAEKKNRERLEKYKEFRGAAGGEELKHIDDIKGLREGYRNKGAATKDAMEKELSPIQEMVRLKLTNPAAYKQLMREKLEDSGKGEDIRRQQLNAANRTRNIERSEGVPTSTDREQYLKDMQNQIFTNEYKNYANQMAQEKEIAQGDVLDRYQRQFSEQERGLGDEMEDKQSRYARIIRELGGQHEIENENLENQYMPQMNNLKLEQAYQRELEGIANQRNVKLFDAMKELVGSPEAAREKARGNEMHDLSRQYVQEQIEGLRNKRKRRGIRDAQNLGMNANPTYDMNY